MDLGNMHNLGELSIRDRFKTILLGLGNFQLTMGREVQMMRNRIGTLGT
jgi:hypothetical protein